MKYYKTFISVFFAIAFAHCSFAQEPGKLLRRYLEEVITQHKHELIGEVFADKYQLHILTDNIHVEKTIDELKAFLAEMSKAMPDIRYTIVDVIEQGDKAVVHAYANGTHKGEMFGYPASGNKIQNLSEVFFCRVKEGKIVDFSTQIDWHNLYRQISTTKQK